MITSTSNPQVKNLLQLQKKSKVRNEEQVFIVEGLRMFMEVPQDQVKKVYVSESLYNKKKEELHLERFPVEVLADKVFQHVSDTKTPQGILCVVKQRKYEIEDLISKENPHFIVLDNLQDPGNLGTILRTAAAANVGAVLLSEGCVDVYNDKTVSSAMGAIFKVPVVQDVTDEQLDQFCSDEDRNIYGTAAEGTVSYVEADYDRPVILAFGNEGNGLPDEFLECCDDVLTIPMRPDTESLNLSMAVGIVLYKAWEKNGFHV